MGRLIAFVFEEIPKEKKKHSITNFGQKKDADGGSILSQLSRRTFPTDFSKSKQNLS